MPAQFTQQPPPAPLESPPLAERFLLESPVVAMIAALAICFIAMWILSRAGRRRLGLAVAGLGVALAAGAYLASEMVETPREELKARTRALIAAAAEADRTALTDLLADSVQVTITAGGIRLGDLDKPGVISRVEDYMQGAYAIEEWSLPTLQAVADGPEVGRTQLRIVVTPQATRFPTGSWWLIHWERIGDRWQAAEIELLSVNRGP